MPSPVALLKFVGTISLGLLTGVSYTLSTQSLPSLLTLPSARPAAHTLQQSTRLATRHIRILSATAATTLLAAFALSPSRLRHPYLLWTAIVAGLSGAVVEERVLFFVSRKAARKDGAGAGTVKEEVLDDSWENVGASGEVNGEMVEKRARERQAVEFIRTGVAGLAFAMGVVGIWGDGA